MLKTLMTRYRGRVRNGRLLVDEATDLPEGSLVELVLPEDWGNLDEDERVRLLASLDRSAADVKKGRVVPAAQVLRDLRRR